MSISEQIKRQTVIQFLVIESTNVAEFSNAVEEAINSGWELAGSAYSGKKGAHLMHYQPLKRRTYGKNT